MPSGKHSASEQRNSEISSDNNTYTSTINPTEGDSHLYTDLQTTKQGTWRHLLAHRVSIRIIILVSVIILVALVSFGVSAIGFLSGNKDGTDRDKYRPRLVALPVSLAQCPDNWTRISNSCYMDFKIRMSWFEARDFCRVLNSDLLSIHTVYELNSVGSKIDLSGSPLWIGLNDLETESDFQWSDGSRVSFTNWDAYKGKGEPNNYNGYEHCAEIKSNLKWNDANCYLSRGFVCKLNLETKCGSGWVFYNNSCFYFSTALLSWNSSQNNCQQLNANLVSINTPGEHAFLLRYASWLNRGNDWIGLQIGDDITSRRFRWVDGTVGTNLPWERQYPYFPANFPYWRCVVLGTYHGNYLNHGCNDYKHFICERSF